MIPGALNNSRFSDESIGTSLRRQVNFTRPCPPDPLGLLGQGLVQKYSLVPADLRCTGASRAQEEETQIHKLPTRAAPALLLFLQVSQSRTGSEFKGVLLGFLQNSCIDA